VRVYSKLPGMYPTVAGKITTNGPYKSVSDVYAIKGLSDKEKSIIKKYEPRVVGVAARFLSQSKYTQASNG